MLPGKVHNLIRVHRVTKRVFPNEVPERWLDIEVQTTKTRPVATVLWSRRREEQASTIVPAIQQPLYRAGQRVIVVRIDGRHDEIFVPPMGSGGDVVGGLLDVRGHCRSAWSAAAGR